jgi:hypothetical protein
MKRHIPDLHLASRNGGEALEGLFLVRVDRAFFRWHPQKPFFALRFAVLEPKEHANQILSGRLYSTSRALWKLNWFLRDFGYDHELFTRDEVDERALLGLKGIDGAKCWNGGGDTQESTPVPWMTGGPMPEN